MQDSFLSLWVNKCLERVNDRHFWNPGVFSYAMIPRCQVNATQGVFFFIVTSTSIVYGWMYRSQTSENRFHHFYNILTALKSVSFTTLEYDIFTALLSDLFTALESDIFKAWKSDRWSVKLDHPYIHSPMFSRPLRTDFELH
jgi:hypothetical protein